MKKFPALHYFIFIFGSITSVVAQNGNDPSIFGIFVGTSPCQDLIRPLHHVPAKAGCDQVKWQLTLHQDSRTNMPTTYTLASEYEVYTSNSTSEKSGSHTFEGTWTIEQNVAGHPGSIFYTLDPEKPERTLSFIRLDDNVIHVANKDKSLMTGDGGQSYSLNRKNPKPTASVKQSLPVSTVDHALTQIVFQGRTPCQEIARVSAIPVAEDCLKLKWLFTLNYNPVTHEPSTYSLARTGHRESPITGTWTILHGTRNNQQAIVYKLKTNKAEESIYLLQADKNVLFFLDREMNLLVGNQDFDYTLNLKTSISNSSPACLTKTDAEKILGEEARALKSTTEVNGGFEKFKCAYIAADPDTTVVRRLDYILEKYNDVASAQKTYSDIVSSNRGLTGQEKIVMGDDAWFHSDGKNFCILMVRKNEKLVRMKVNKLTDKTSLQALKDIMKTITSSL